MTEVNKIIEKALGEYGTRETPKGSNNVKYNTWYYGKPVSGSQYAWCSVFVLWCFNQAGLMHLTPFSKDNMHKKVAERAFNWLENGGEVILNPEYIKTGDVVVYNFSHVGIATSNSDDRRLMFNSVEGNTDEAGSPTGGCVMSKSRNLKDVKGIYRPRYDFKGVTEPITKNEEEKQMRYKTINDVPEWGKYSVQARIDEGVFSDETDIDLSNDMVRLMVLQDRYFKKIGLFTDTLELAEGVIKSE